MTAKSLHRSAHQTSKCRLLVVSLRHSSSVDFLWSQLFLSSTHLYNVYPIKFIVLRGTSPFSAFRCSVSEFFTLHTIVLKKEFEFLFRGVEELKRHFQAKFGYDGCVADFDIVHDAAQLLSIESKLLHSPRNPLHSAKYTGGIKLGCRIEQQRASEGSWETSSLSSRCQPGVCGFGGRCVQQLNTYFCDCVMSGFNGPVCTDGMTKCSIRSDLI